MIGQQFHRLLVISATSRHSKAGHIVWKCKCVCGEEVYVISTNLRRNSSKSCGCLRKEQAKLRKANFRHGQASYKEGITSEYKTWSTMIQRCTNPNRKDYHYYGGRGITICERWLNSFEAFFTDMGERPKDMTLDRVDSDSNYEPGNCRWSTPKEQVQNRRKPNLSLRRIL